jgi:3-dehydroquinate synthase
VFNAKKAILESKIKNFKSLPKLSNIVKSESSSILIYDEKLEKVDRRFSKWTNQFDLAIKVRAGEKLKSLAMIEKVSRMALKSSQNWSRKHTCVYVAGGGSVGDFGGFFASIFLRGVALVHIPTTWLAAIDSAHGGKTGLNVLGLKNQLGTFHSAQEVWIVESFFQNQSLERFEDCLGEVAKMSLLDRSIWSHLKTRLTPSDLIRVLPRLIKAKYKVVTQDPFETEGLRIFLNLGHSLGHLLESHYKMGHGRAVRLGLFFSLWLSRKKGILSNQNHAKLTSKMESIFGFQAAELKAFRPPQRQKMNQIILRDKKMSSQTQLQFVGLKGAGEPILLRISVAEFLDLTEEYWRSL